MKWKQHMENVMETGTMHGIDMATAIWNFLKSVGSVVRTLVLWRAYQRPFF